ncbi:MAG: aminoacyl-tRNA hydrolase [Deltaproteobacteria bacterium]|nr:aminoacyl-tRNA hydrolase [Deltaproteobacteria bacterium]
MYFICGLGNKGLAYKNTRHNAGYLVVERLSSRLGLPLCQKIHGSIIGLSDNILLAKPQTFMNLSGKMVQILMKEFNIESEHLIIVHDDMDLEFGELKIKWNGGDGGHRGVRSVIEHIGTRDFFRLKVGIGRPKSENAEDYVLSPFTEEEKNLLPEIIDRAAQAIETLIREGKHKAMSLYNRKWMR